MPTPVKITEPVRSARLRRPLVPSVTKDSEIRGLALHVTSTRSFWALTYQPRGHQSLDWQTMGRRRSHELGDAMLMTVAEARTAALAAKALVRAGRSPHHERLASTASAVAQRAVLPSTVDEALGAYATALMNRRQPSEATRRKSIHYARKAVRLMKADPLTLAALTPAMARVMLETMTGLRRRARPRLPRTRSLPELGASNKDSSRLTLATRSTATKNREAHSRATTSPRSTSCAPCGTPSKTNRNAILCGSCCSFRCDATRPSAWRGTKSTCSCDASESQRTARKPAKPTNCHCQNQRWRCSRRASPRRKANWFFPAPTAGHITGLDHLLTRIRARIGHGDTKKAERFSFHDVRRSFVSHLAERGYRRRLARPMSWPFAQGRVRDLPASEPHGRARAGDGDVGWAGDGCWRGRKRAGFGLSGEAGPIID